MGRTQSGKRLRRALSVLPEGLEIELVLGAPARALVPDELVTTQEVDRHPIEAGTNPALPRLVKVDPADLGQNVDPIRRSAELSDAAPLYEVTLSQSLPRESERVERIEEPMRVGRLRPDEDIDVSGEAGEAVEGDGVTADDDELNPARAE